MNKNTILTLLFLVSVSYCNAQNNFFTSADNSQLSKKKEVLSNIKKKRVYSLDEKAMRSYLRKAPLEFKNNGQTLPLDIPLPDGTVETFSMVESPLLSPEVAAANPSIKTYIGTGLNDKKASISLSLTSAGFNAIILNVGGETVYFDSYSKEKSNVYFNYYVKDVITPAGEKSKSCLVEFENEVQIDDSKKKESNRQDRLNATVTSSGTQLRTYRLAVAATGEFTTTLGGGTKAGGLAAVVAYVNRVRAIFRVELAVDLSLVSGENLIYTAAATDPFDQNAANLNTVLGVNVTNTDTVLGNANYDIGHLFGFQSGSGQGIAGTSSVCNAGKARGLSFIGTVSSYSQVFMDNLILHEMGHQFGMSHSYNSVQSVCTTRNAATSVEPGSGATIMSYGFICGSDNAAGTPYNALLQYHTVNYEQAIAYINTKTCQVTTATGNTPPVLIVPAGYTIPKSTPFVLTGSATDVNTGNVLTYCWEGTDIGNVVPDATTLDDTTKPPFFRSYAPSSSPSRTYPALANILNGTNQDKGDKLPSIGIVTKHTLTVRDNVASGGGVTNSANVNVTVDGNIGPFLITSNLTGIVNSLSQATITWSVNGTNVATPLVTILLSTDGGLTFPVALANATPNDGTQVVNIPNISVTTDKARIKVEAVGNIFFDISNTNFTIRQAMSLAVTGSNVFSGGAATGTATVSVTGGTTTSNYTATYNFTNGPYNIDNPLVTYSTITLPALPTGATINTAALNFNTISALSNSWQRDIRASLSGVYTLPETQIAGGLTGTVATGSVNLANFITTGGSISLSFSDLNNDNTGFEAKITSARIDINYAKNGYTYLWSNGATTPTITGLAAGTYSVTVTDAFGTTATGSYIVRSEFQLTATAGSNGTISPAGTSRVASGGSLTYTFTPNTCFKVGAVLVNGVSVGSPSTYTFSNVVANATISVSFIADSTVVYTTTTISACSSYTWPDNGTTYTSSGTYTGTTTGCTTQRLILIITPSSFQDTTVSACSLYTWTNNNITYASSGTYIGTTTNCVTQRLILTITPLAFQNTTISACDTYTWSNNSQTYTASGTYFGTTTGCVTQRLILTITPSSFQDTTISACDSYTWSNNSVRYTASGTYTGTTTGCVTQRLILTITPSSIQTTTVSACDSYVWNGTTYTTTGLYTGTTTNCVTQKLNLTITPSSIQTTTISACDSYTWSNNSVRYTTSGTYTGTTTGCVTQRLILTITPSSFQTTTISACDSYVWNGTTYTATGIYTGTTTNCVTQRLNLTITPSSIQTTTISACDSYVWNGTTYTATAIYTGTTTNCVTPRLNLTITPSSFQTTTVSACDSYVWNGMTYTTTGIYTGTTTNCVTQRLNLTITPSSIQTTTVSACDSYVWNGTTYTTTGIYTGTTTNCVTQQLNLVINRTTWNGTSWTNGVPDSTTKATISGNYSQAANLTACSLEVTGAAVVTVPAGFNFMITGKVTVAPTASLTFENNTNLVQLDDVQNSGFITVNRNSSLLKRLDYTIWSSPVTNPNLSLMAFSPLTISNRFYNYNESTNLYNVITNPSTLAFNLAAGYFIRMPNNHPIVPTVWAESFTGIANNGTINKSISYSGSLFGYNMVGNPYPSAIDAEAFVTANTNQIEGSLYFWRKVNGASGSAYAVYTKAGSTRTVSSDIPNGIIQVGQGFFIKAKSGVNTITFTNSMRLSNNSNQFFKYEKVVRDRFWLNLSDVSGAFSQMMIGYFEEATLGIDDFDAKYINDSPIAITSILNNEEYSIQGRPKFIASDVVPLQFKTDVAGAYKISLDHTDGLFANGQDLFLVDNVTGIETNLKEDSYSFEALTSIYNNRFYIKYQKSLSIDENIVDVNDIKVYKNNEEIYIKSNSHLINDVKVYDVLGRQLAHQKNLNSLRSVIKNLRKTNQVLMLKIVLKDRAVVNKKLIY